MLRLVYLESLLHTSVDSLEFFCPQFEIESLNVWGVFCLQSMLLCLDIVFVMLKSTVLTP